MSFRFQRRINLGSGAGINLGKTGASGSVRGRHGSIGTSGFSLRSGIPGLSYRQSWGKGGGGLAVMLVMVMAGLAVAVIMLALQLVLIVVPLAWQGVRWCALTARDYIEYRRTGIQSPGDLQAPIPTSTSDPEQRLAHAPEREPTLAEIMRKDKPSSR